MKGQIFFGERGTLVTAPHLNASLSQKIFFLNIEINSIPQHLVHSIDNNVLIQFEDFFSPPQNAYSKQGGEKKQSAQFTATIKRL